MKNLTKKEIFDYYYSCFVKVDGLWFMKVEEKYGFAEALAIDEEVWKVLPKIQARFLKEKFTAKNYNNETDLFANSIKSKLELDKYSYTLKKLKDRLILNISECPWHNILIKSKREELSEKIGGVICKIEYSVFAEEFNYSCAINTENRICKNGKNCEFYFNKI